MAEFDELDVDALNDFVAEYDPFMLDVRETYEFESIAIPGAVNIPLGEVPRRLHEIPRDRVILVICERGTRSERVAKFLIQQEFEQVVNLLGGTSAWSAGQ